MEHIKIRPSLSTCCGTLCFSSLLALSRRFCYCCLLCFSTVVCVAWLHRVLNIYGNFDQIWRFDDGEMTSIVKIP